MSILTCQEERQDGGGGVLNKWRVTALDLPHQENILPNPPVLVVTLEGFLVHTERPHPARKRGREGGREEPFNWTPPLHGIHNLLVFPFDVSRGEIVPCLCILSVQVSQNTHSKGGRRGRGRGGEGRRREKGEEGEAYVWLQSDTALKGLDCQTVVLRSGGSTAQTEPQTLLETNASWLRTLVTYEHTHTHAHTHLKGVDPQGQLQTLHTLLVLREKGRPRDPLHPQP